MTAPETAAVVDYLLREHSDVLDGIRACAAAAARRATDESGRTETTAVRQGTETLLRRAGVWTQLPPVLAGCVDAMGETLRATPVAAPPYVAATATGIVLRATLESGRLVISVNALAVVRGERASASGVTLTPRDGPLETLVDVELR